MLIVIRLRKRWMTVQTGKAGDENEPEIMGEDDKELEQFKLGFGTEVRADVPANPNRGDPALPDL